MDYDRAAYEAWREQQMREDYRRRRDEADEKDRRRRGGRDYDDGQYRPGKCDEWGGDTRLG